MLNMTKIALAAALVFGGATVALAGEGSPDLSTSPVLSDLQPVAGYGGAYDAYAQIDGRRDRFTFERAPVRGVSHAEKLLMDRESGGINNN